MNKLENIISKLESNLENSYKIMIGFDGFIDEICHVVDERITQNSFKRIDTIEAYAKRIGSYAGLSGNIEIVPIQKKLGGNAPIMGNALLETGNFLTFIGAVGEQSINPLFQDFIDKCCNFISIAEPGHTDALEFHDGKIMLGKTDSMSKVNWANIVDASTIAEIKQLTGYSDLIAFTNWTALFGMNSIIEGFTEVLKELKTNPFVFFDLADPTKRDKQDIREGLFYIQEIAKVSKTILGLNTNESRLIAEILKIKEDDLTARASAIREKLDLYSCVIHDIKGASSSHKDYAQWIDGPFTPTPKLSTGAGDNFNAGFCYGILNGLSPLESLNTGVASSGFYVRNCKSANQDQLINFLKNMNTNTVVD